MSAAKLTQKIMMWWSQRPTPFMLPPLYGGHQHEWESIDLDCVGCSLCGVVHICGSANNIVPCCIEQQMDSSVVCTLTGIVLRNFTLFDSEISCVEYSNGRSNHGHVRAQHSMADEVEYLCKVCMRTIELLMFSEMAASCREMESVSYRRKISISFMRHMKRSKTGFTPCNTLDGLEASLNSIKFAREPRDISQFPPIQHFYPLMQEIVQLVMVLELPKPYRQKINNDKITNILIALFYVAVDGITVNDHIFLSASPILKQTLPVQLLLWPVFKIQPRLITEGENIVKMCIKNMRPIEFSKHCVASIHKGVPICPFVNDCKQCICKYRPFY